MLQERQLFSDLIIKPRSFAGLMSLYESNFSHLQRLVPELDRLDGYFQSHVAGECDLQLEIIDRSRYTVTLSLSYYFIENGERVIEPDMTVRAYLDGRLAEALSYRGAGRHGPLNRLLRVHNGELNARWRRNMVLNKWLEYLWLQGHLILER